MPGASPFLAAALLVAGLALPYAVAAAEPERGASAPLNFEPPKGWTDASRPVDRPGLWKDWIYRDGGVVHSIVLSVTRERLAAVPYGEAAVAVLKASAGISAVEGRSTTTCGDVPAYEYTYRSDRTAGHPLFIRHVLVDIAGLIGDASYAHPRDVADLPAALDALSTMCERQLAGLTPPPGWSAAGVRSADANASIALFTGPGDTGTLMGVAFPAPARFSAVALAPAVAKPGETILSDTEETCGSIHVRRVSKRATSQSGLTLVEVVTGYRHGASYFRMYSRPDGAPPDAAAEQALTSFCDGTPALRSPAPA